MPKSLPILLFWFVSTCTDQFILYGIHFTFSSYNKVLKHISIRKINQYYKGVNPPIIFVNSSLINWRCHRYWYLNFFVYATIHIIDANDSVKNCSQEVLFVKWYSCLLFVKNKNATNSVYLKVSIVQIGKNLSLVTPYFHVTKLIYRSWQIEKLRHQGQQLIWGGNS